MRTSQEKENTLQSMEETKEDPTDFVGQIVKKLSGPIVQKIVEMVKEALSKFMI